MPNTEKYEAVRPWKLIGKFLKRLGPILPIAAWAIYLVPPLATNNRIFYIYSAFIIVSGYLCFYQPRSLAQKINAGNYNEQQDGYRWKQAGNVLDAVFMGIIAYSLAGLLVSICWSVTTIPLASLVHITGMPDHATLLCVACSSLIGALRYRQKTDAHNVKTLASQQQLSKNLDTGFLRANDIINRWTRALCDGIIIFYNCFFVGSSAIIVLCGAHMTLLIEQYVLTKMLLLSGILTTTVAFDNQKGSRDYLTRKVEALANARWSETQEAFVEVEQQSLSPS